ncbi:MAG: recombination protein RecR, recombination protein RecR [Candidatus Parcubacteria bacterium]|jgi:recombination protein RecR
MNPLDKLTELFKEFPGIGPRQARRFSYFLLARNNGFVQDLVEAVKKLRQDIRVCSSCFRFFSLGDTTESKCVVCRNPNRDTTSLMIVSRDNDVDHMEKTGLFNGLYFVLGGSLPILEKEPEKRIRIKELLQKVESKTSTQFSEIILALDLNPEGEHTEIFLKKMLDPLSQSAKFKISTLGRGLSTGTEIEYSDAETLKNALKNRS